MKTTDFRSLPPAAQEDLRRKTVNAVLEGMNKTAAAKTFGITRQAVGKWMRLYGRGGERALDAKKRGAPKREGLLKPWQCALVVRTITDKCPEQARLPGFWLWTRDAVKDYIERKFGIVLSLSSVAPLGPDAAETGTARLPTRRTRLPSVGGGNVSGHPCEGQEREGAHFLG